MRTSRLANLLLSAVLLAAGIGAAAPMAYCYRTLADVVCYLAPDVGRDRRYVGSYGPVPMELLPPTTAQVACPPPADNVPRELRGHDPPQPAACSGAASSR